MSLTRPRAILAWSSGKDSAWALHELRRQNKVEVVGLLTTIRQTDGHVTMHAVPEALLDAQAQAVGLPLNKLYLPDPCPNAVYERIMGGFLKDARAMGITAVAFGDLFLDEIRQYREERMAGTGITPLFPLWGRDTKRLAREMVDAGLRAWITCVDPIRLPTSFAGRLFDAALLDDLPAGVDPCGERGEFHTFVFDGPMFIQPVAASPGEAYRRGDFAYARLEISGARPAQ